MGLQKFIHHLCHIVNGQNSGASYIEEVIKAFGEVGEGNLNWPEIIEACRQTEARACIVEQDNCYGKDPFDCLQTSYNNMVKFGL